MRGACALPYMGTTQRASIIFHLLDWTFHYTTTLVKRTTCFPRNEMRTDLLAAWSPCHPVTPVVCRARAHLPLIVADAAVRVLLIEIPWVALHDIALALISFLWLPFYASPTQPHHEPKNNNSIN